jgi:chromosome segregation ATPase
LVAATHALKKNMGANVEGVGDDKEVASGGGQGAKGNNSTEEANQSRKMTAAPVPARKLKPGPIANPGENPGLQDNQSQQSTPNDPQPFAQQFRGYLDHVEGESRNAAKENAHLRERLEERETETKAVVSQLLIVTKRAELAETELEIASKNNEELVSNLQVALTEKDDVIARLQSQINDWADRAEKAEKRLEVADREVAENKAISEKLEAEYVYIVGELESKLSNQCDDANAMRRGLDNLKTFYEDIVGELGSKLRDQSDNADSIRRDLEAWKIKTARAKNELEVAERELAESKTINKNLKTFYKDIVEELGSKLRDQSEDADTMRSDLETSKAETAILKILVFVLVLLYIFEPAM